MQIDRLRLLKPLHVVEFATSGKGRITTLPSGATVSVTGASLIPGCVEIVYDEVRYNVFQEDLPMKNGNAKEASG